MHSVLKSRLTRVVAPLALAVAGLCLATAPADAQRSALMQRETITVPGHPNALCNDGTAPIVYFQAGPGDDRNKWVIYLQGGAGCATDAACADRARDSHDLTSSDDVNLPDVLVSDGVLSSLPAANPDFAGYTHVFVHYCSSDAYAGDAARMIGGKTWQFRGKEIVDAVLEQLSQPADPTQPSLKNATEVLLAGSSAGAWGVHNNLDRVAARLAPIPVRGLADSGWIPYGITPIGPGSFDVRPDGPGAYAYYNARPDDSCVAANAANPGLCLNQNYAFPYITTPMFVYADRRDPSLRAVVGMLDPPQTPAEVAFAADYARQTETSLATTVPAYFIADIGRHTVALLASYARTTAGGVTLGTVLHDWYFGTPGPVIAAPTPTPTAAAR